MADYEESLSGIIGLSPTVTRVLTIERPLEASLSSVSGESKTQEYYELLVGLSPSVKRTFKPQRAISAVQLGLIGGPAEQSQRLNVSVGLGVSMEYEGPAYSYEFATSIGLTGEASDQPKIVVLTTSIGLRKRIAAKIPKTFDPVLEYYSGGAWVTEPDLISFEYTDDVGARIRTVDAVVGNPDSWKEEFYSSYMEVRIRDDVSDEILFYGKLEDASPGDATLTLTIKDGLSELGERQVDTLTGGPFGRRSDMISSLIQQNSYGTNFSYAIETSATSGSYDRTFSATEPGPSALSEVERIAMEDPWDATPTGYGYDFYLTYVSDWVKQKFEYFKRGSKPAAPVSSNGLTLRRGGTVGGDQERAILPGYKIRKEGSDVVTKVRVFYEVLKDASNENLGKERLYVDEVNSSLEASIGRSKLLTINRPEISTSTEAQELAQAVLARCGDSDIYRMLLDFQGFPIIDVSGTPALVRAGHLVYVTGLSGYHTAFNGTDMFLTSLKYSWPANTAHCELLTDKAKGSNFAGFDPLEYFSRSHEAAQDLTREVTTLPADLPVPPYAADEIERGVLPVASNLVFSASNSYRIAWTSGSVTWADGVSQSIPSSSYYDLPDMRRYYFYVEYGDGTLNVVDEDHYSDAIGAGKALIAIARRNSDSSEYAYLASIGTDTPIIAAGQIICTSLSAIKADMGLLTAGEIRLGSGTVGSNFTGLRMYKSGSTYRLAGYNGDQIQAYFDSDGKFKSGDDAVTIDRSGITFDTPYGSATAYLKLKYNGTQYGSVSAHPTYGLWLAGTTNGLSLTVTAGYLNIIGIPTSNPGVFGAVYRDGTDLKISTG